MNSGKVSDLEVWAEEARKASTGKWFHTEIELGMNEDWKAVVRAYKDIEEKEEAMSYVCLPMTEWTSDVTNFVDGNEVGCGKFWKEYIALCVHADSLG